jgi:hypothetical protein
MAKSNRNTHNPGVGLKQTETTFGKTARHFLLALTVLPLLFGCASDTTSHEVPYNDFFEVRSYEVVTETYTNEIVTTVFTLRLAETNVIKTVSKPTVTDFGGYDWDYVETPVVKENLTTPEFQCVDGSCGIGGDINVPSK